MQVNGSQVNGSQVNGSQVNGNMEDHAVATALNGVIVRGEQNLLAGTAAPGIEGARAALETFYHAFNARSLDLMRQIWANDPLVEVGSPIAGVVRGSADITAGYARMFSAPPRVQTIVEDIVAYLTPELVVFVGGEVGAYASNGEHATMAELPAFHSICVFRFIAQQGGWRLVYHHVWLDDAEQLARYQSAIRGA